MLIESVLSSLVATVEDQTWEKHKGVSVTELRKSLSENPTSEAFYKVLNALYRWKYVKGFTKNRRLWVKITELGAETHFFEDLS